MAIKIAVLVFKEPLAIGLLFLKGCFASMLLSNTSFIKYPPLTTSEKIKKPWREIINKSSVNTCPEKKRGAKIRRFFTHCLGLRDRIISNIII